MDDEKLKAAEKLKQQIDIIKERLFRLNNDNSRSFSDSTNKRSRIYDALELFNPESDIYDLFKVIIETKLNINLTKLEKEFKEM